MAITALDMMKFGVLQSFKNVYAEQGVVVDSATYLTAPGKLPDSAERVILFGSFELEPGAPQGGRLISWESLEGYFGNNDFSGGVVTDPIVRWESVSGDTEFDKLFSNLPDRGHRVHMLATAQRDSSTVVTKLAMWDNFEGWRTNGGVMNGTAVETDPGQANYRLLRKHTDNTKQLRGTVYRIACWIDTADSVPDVGQEIVQNLFATDSNLVDPVKSQNQYGDPLFDCYGPASVWNSGDSFAYGPAFTVSGSFTDA